MQVTYGLVASKIIRDQQQGHCQTNISEDEQHTKYVSIGEETSNKNISHILTIDLLHHNPALTLATIDYAILCCVP